MNQVMENPGADVALADLFSGALDEWAKRAWLPETQGATDVITGGLRGSLRVEPAARSGSQILVQLHDGPGDRGRTYGAAEQVLRAGSHAFMYRGLEAALPQLAAFIEAATGAVSGSLGTPSYPAPTGDWTPQPGGKTYSF
jgi:hypothetical protein